MLSFALVSLAILKSQVSPSLKEGAGTCSSAKRPVLKKIATRARGADIQSEARHALVIVPAGLGGIDEPLGDPGHRSAPGRCVATVSPPERNVAECRDMRQPQICSSDRMLANGAESHGTLCAPHKADF